MPPELLEELVEEVLLRLPPGDPASLVRAALVCRLWRRLVSGAAFRRRFREFHRTPPLLGFLCDPGDEDDYEEGVYVPASSFRPRAPLYRPFSCWRAWDARHGRVLLHKGHSHYSHRPYVWTPITGPRMAALPKMPPDRPDSWTTAVLCAAAAATGTGACDHLDCHDGPFIVVLVGTDTKGMFSYVFSSETYKWSEVTTAEHPGDCISWNRSTLVENALHFMFEKNDRILKYDLRTRGMSLMELPRYVGTNLISEAFVELMTTKEGRLGFARLEESKLCLWSRDHGDVGYINNYSMNYDYAKLLTNILFPGFFI